MRPAWAHVMASSLAICPRMGADRIARKEAR